MVDSELVKDGGIEVADADLVLDDIVAIVVGFPVSDTSFDSSTGHPGGETFGVVVASVLIAFQLALTISGPSKFPGENNEGLIEHSALLEILDESGAGLVDIVGLSAHSFSGRVDVVVPATVE